jgi:chemotaxis protein methyltransferase CheR
MTPDEFRAFSSLIHEASGIHLGEVKYELLRARLGKRLRALGLDSYQDYLEVLERDPDGLETDRMVDVVTTNKTEFFREARHYEHLCERLLPAYQARLQAGKDPVLRMWSAACSSGEEPYSLAMVVQEALGSAGQIKILATDISSRMIRKGMEGLYPAERTATVPRSLLDRYFQPGPEPQSWRAAPRLRGLISFARFNLNDPDQFVFRNKFDAIFCRNVMIYFDRPTQEALVNRLAAHLAPGGYLYTGFSESLLGIKHGLKGEGASIYRKPG